MHMPSQRTRQETPSPGHIRRGLGLALLALALPGLAEAVPYVKSVEYVEIPIGNLATTATVNLTKGQVVANCVPFASMMTSGVDDQFDQFFTDVFFQAAPPARVTAQRFTAGGTLSVGVFVVEFDPAYVNVRQGPFAMGAGTATTNAAIPATTLTKAALVSYYQHGAVTNSWTDYAIAGWFSAGNQLMWQRNFSAGAVSGHYFVFEARNTEFSVQALSFGIANNATSANQAITAVDMDKSMVIASYRTAYNSFENEDGQIGVFLANPTTLTAQRTFETGPPARSTTSAPSWSSGATTCGCSAACSTTPTPTLSRTRPSGPSTSLPPWSGTAPPSVPAPWRTRPAPHRTGTPLSSVSSSRTRRPCGATATGPARPPTARASAISRWWSGTPAARCS